jgi:hypothetical protein
MPCLFCNKPAKNYNPGSGVDYVCSGCAIILCSADQDDLKRSYAKALGKGYLRKANAVELFLRREEKHGRRPDKSIKRNINRKRATRSIRNQKRLSQQTEA